jgi:prepilin-type N-terminal cleavage/methylation domain-containing protein/prepilin-type processing-associated H-X9-DG protein
MDRRTHVHRLSNGFTLIELAVVLGLVTVLTSLLLPAVAKVKSAANKAACASNLRQVGTAWSLYTAENRGHLMDYVWFTPKTPDVAWNGYWPGVMDHYDIRDRTLLCPSACDEPSSNRTRGYGAAKLAWTGKYATNGTAIRLNAKTFRDSSYGMNRYLTADGGFNDSSSQLTTTMNLGDVPVFMDAAYVDVRPLNGTADAPVSSPPNLQGTAITPGTPEHWNFLLARHGRGINVFMADGSVRWVVLDDMYSLTWKANWVPTRLVLPNF